MSQNKPFQNFKWSENFTETQNDQGVNAKTTMRPEIIICPKCLNVLRLSLSTRQVAYLAGA